MSTTHPETPSRVELEALLARGPVGKRTPAPIGPARHLAAERDRLLALTWEHFDATLQASTIGAEISGIDLEQAVSDPEAIAEIRAALLDYKVIFFRNQHLTEEQHVAFAAAFGELEQHPFLNNSDSNPHLVRFEKTEEIGGYENAWHSDVTWREVPSMGSILRAIEVPAVGGDTLFCDMYAAWDGLEEPVRARVEEMSAEHDALRAFGAGLSIEEAAAKRVEFPVQVHPIGRTHPETNRKLLYVNRVFTERILGLDEEESESLLQFLCNQADMPEYQCRFRWTAGAIAFWDNRAVQHYASSDYWPQRRVMERATVVGTRPY
ncbi:MAG: alpha-ketoglutarate-dependent taurine dioxygenase [Candidatus Poriferisodalaceae bacterium]